MNLVGLYSMDATSVYETSQMSNTIVKSFLLNIPVCCHKAFAEWPRMDRTAHDTPSSIAISPKLYLLLGISMASGLGRAN